MLEQYPIQNKQITEQKNLKFHEKKNDLKAPKNSQRTTKIWKHIKVEPITILCNNLISDSVRTRSYKIHYRSNSWRSLSDRHLADRLGNRPARFWTAGPHRVMRNRGGMKFYCRKCSVIFMRVLFQGQVCFRFGLSQVRPLR